MQADVFGAADLALQVEAGTQNPELGTVDLWSPQQFQEPPGRRRVASGSDRSGRPQEALFQRRHHATDGLRLFHHSLPDLQCSAVVVSLAGLKHWSGSVAPRSENSVDDTPHCKELRSFLSAPCPICRAR